MARSMKEGDLVSIPCRPCGKRLIPFVIHAGKHVVTCPACRAKTRITVTKESDQWRIRTSGA